MTDQQLDDIEAAYMTYAATAALQKVAAGHRLVPPAGSVEAPLVLVGEAPGEDEEREGEPFVGKTGQLLQELFRKATLPWDLCYRTNVLPWRPPGNRTPYPFEIEASRGRLMREITIIRPVIVVAAGSSAWKGLSPQAMYGTFDDVLGKLIPWSPWQQDWGGGCSILAIRHPGALVRMRGEERRAAEEQTVTALRSITKE